MPQSSQLAAIMVTDIIGHADLLKDDEKKAMLLSSKNKTIQEPLIEKHNGRWLKEMKDGSWASFDNTLDAVNCAREIQATMKLQPSFEVAINIHLGEVSFQDNEIVGDGINATTAIRTKNVSSGVFISEAIYNTIRNNQSINLSGIDDSNSKQVSNSSKSDNGAMELSMDDTLLKKLAEAIEENIENEQFGVEDLASEVSLSRSHLHRKLQQLTGQSISQYIRAIRLEKSMILLQKDVATISEIAYRVGFGSPTYFIKCFHEHYGYPPGEVKKRQNQKLEEGGKIETEILKDGGVELASETVHLYQVKDTWNKAVINRVRAAIMMTDIYEFSAIAQKNQEDAQALLVENQEIQKKLIEQHEGTWIKSFGDSTLAYFTEGSNSLDCALAIQKEVSKNAKYQLKIGLNYGNLIFEDEEVYGEGLNLTARLARLGTPSSILISQRIIDHLDQKIENYNRKFLGSFQLKGINRNVGLYALSSDFVQVPDEESILEKLKPSDIEGLQTHQSRFIIEQIYQKMNLVSGNSNPLDTDVRIMAHDILRNFPWPISVELRRLFSASLRETGLRRLLQLVKCIDRILKLLTFILINEFHSQILKSKTASIPEIGSRLKTLGSRDILYLLKVISTSFSDKNLPYFMEEMKDLFTEDFFDGIKKWAEEKNNILESGPDLNDDQLERKCEENEKFLTEVLLNLCFMINYRLVNVGTIRVMKPKNKPARFEHSIDILNSPDSEFSTREELMDNFSDSNAVLIMKNISDPENFLNLSPLVLDTHNEMIGTRSNIKRDIFLFDQFRDGKIYYAGTEVSEKVTLENLPNYDLLREEFEELVNHLSNINSQEK